MATDRQFFDVTDMTDTELSVANALFAANKAAASAKAELAMLIADRLGLAEGTLKVYAKWGKISGEIVEAAPAKSAKAKQSLADYVASMQANGRSV